VPEAGWPPPPDPFLPGANRWSWRAAAARTGGNRHHGTVCGRQYEIGRRRSARMGSWLRRKKNRASPPVQQVGSSPMTPELLAARAAPTTSWWQGAGLSAFWIRRRADLPPGRDVQDAPLALQRRGRRQGAQGPPRLLRVIVQAAPGGAGRGLAPRRREALLPRASRSPAFLATARLVAGAGRPAARVAGEFGAGRANPAAAAPAKPETAWLDGDPRNPGVVEVKPRPRRPDSWRDLRRLLRVGVRRGRRGGPPPGAVPFSTGRWWTRAAAGSSRLGGPHSGAEAPFFPPPPAPAVTGAPTSTPPPRRSPTPSPPSAWGSAKPRGPRLRRGASRERFEELQVSLDPAGRARRRRRAGGAVAVAGARCWWTSAGNSHRAPS